MLLTAACQGVPSFESRSVKYGRGRPAFPSALSANGRGLFSSNTPSASCPGDRWPLASRSEEHTSELQSRSDLVCRLLLEKKKKTKHLLHETTRERIELHFATNL